MPRTGLGCRVRVGCRVEFAFLPWGWGLVCVRGAGIAVGACLLACVLVAGLPPHTLRRGRGYSKTSTV